MMTETLFFDTYALIEMHEGNPRYARFHDAKIVMNMLNLFELTHYFIRTGMDTNSLIMYEGVLSPVEFSDAINGAKTKHEHKKFKLSMADCIGYETARRLGIKFLTGDKAFKGMKNVEYVA
jgi:predicted nucleic acid-binding protein